MTKFLHDDVMDGALNIIKNNANLMTICSAAPTTRTQAISTYMLADVAVTGTDFTVGNGDASGRKITCAAKTGVEVDNTGTATHRALVDGSRLLAVTEEATSKYVVDGDTVNFDELDWNEIADPT